MTEEEFKRYRKAADIKTYIGDIESELEYLNIEFSETNYPRTESGWCLSVSLNDRYKKLSLTSEEFWECIDLIKRKKEEKLKKYREQFENL